ncbi:Protein NRT1/ PTR FAMILY 8.2 [Hibiscus syriacus]|uniref:Protein NRT1/ PTR FAMILY 8.2 n=1 Tax=Hibiscus syriacus TaxID=106335 RepID=A0A6A2W9Z7_HIBSY|nr:Protein NRT1/ PTR FAMILY 8.2 [Hibiscus syriacus]
MGLGFGIPAAAMVVAVVFFFAGFFDKAAVETQNDYIGESINSWSLCTVTQVEELKSVIRLLPVWASGIVFATVYSQMNTILVMPIFAMITAGILEVVRLGIVQKNNFYDLESIPMSIFWQVPEYFLVGCAEVFTFVGQLEFFYDQAPDAMRSLCSALSLTTVALGNYLSTVLVIAVTKITTRDGKLGWIPDNLNRGHLDYFFWLLAILSLLNFLLYIWIARWYTYKKVVGHP